SELLTYNKARTPLFAPSDGRSEADIPRPIRSHERASRTPQAASTMTAPADLRDRVESAMAPPPQGEDQISCHRHHDYKVQMSPLHGGFSVPVAAPQHLQGGRCPPSASLTPDW